MSAYVKFVCDYCVETEIEFWDTDSIELARANLEDLGWETLDGDMCRLCRLRRLRRLCRFCSA